VCEEPHRVHHELSEIFRHYRRWMPALSRTDGRRIATSLGLRHQPDHPAMGTKMGTGEGVTPLSH